MRKAVVDLLKMPISSQVAGHLALDFCNTAGEHLAATPDEMLLDWEIFLRWASQVGLIGAQTYRQLLSHSLEVESIVELREAIYRVGLAIARGEVIPQRDLTRIRKQANSAKPPVVSSRKGIRWRPDSIHAADALRSILASEALSLFCSPRAARIGICNGGLCGWLFLDDSRGRRRRWCDMKDCGNRAKARRYYEQEQMRKDI